MLVPDIVMTEQVSVSEPAARALLILYPGATTSGWIDATHIYKYQYQTRIISSDKTFSVDVIP